MSTIDSLTAEDKEFLAKCEEEFKYRFTEEDKEFMKVFNAEPSTPPIIESWWVPNNSGRRNERRHDRRNHPYERSAGNRDRNYHGNYHNRRDDRRGYNDYDRGAQGYRNQRPRYY